MDIQYSIIQVSSFTSDSSMKYSSLWQYPALSRVSEMLSPGSPPLADAWIFLPVFVFQPVTQKQNWFIPVPNCWSFSHYINPSREDSCRFLRDIKEGLSRPFCNNCLKVKRHTGPVFLSWPRINEANVYCWALWALWNEALESYV